MRKHIITPFGMGVRALALLALCAAATGCKDEYTLDDAKPAWLGESVLKGLQERGEFTNYLKLMHDLEMDDILDRTGSRTLFAAPDSAFEAFYAKNRTLPENNPWHTAVSYETLSPSQKLLLAKCSMLNNAITMETLANSDGTVERGQYMRRKTLVSVTDSVAYLTNAQLPYSYNPNDTDPWADLRSEGYVTGSGPDLGEGKGAYLTDGDGTSNMMVFFTAEHMANNSMVSSDLELVVGESRRPTDVHVYDARVDEQDFTCQNGYINFMSKVISPLPNMAEVIRTNGETNIFSHILDRFSIPVYIDGYNTSYRNLHEDFTGKIWTKWYVSPVTSQYTGLSGQIQSTKSSNVTTILLPTGSEASDVKRLIAKDETGADYELKYDPAWNAINVSGTGVYGDMACMFVPDDATLLRGFKDGGQLYNLIETYATPEQVIAAQSATLDNLEPLYVAIDQVPLSTIQAMVNNVMKESFVASTESKFATLKNDAAEDLFPGGVCDVKNVKLACNGAVYVTSAIYAPADYVSVAAPAFISKDKRVIRWAIYNGSTSAQDYMNLNYYAYLKAMTSRFTFFLPTDEAMKFFYDCSSFKSKHPRKLEFSIDESTSGFPIKAKAYNYDDATGTIGQYYMTEQFDNTDITGRLKDVLESHTIVHENESELMTGLNKNQYYLTKGGTAVKVERDANGYVTRVKGGFQIDNERNGLVSTEETHGLNGCNVETKSLYVSGGNGDTYVLDAPIIPTSKSVYRVLSEHDNFSVFFDLCANIDANIATDMGFYPKGATSALKKQLDKKYNVFWLDNGLDQNVAFFNAYNYTVYVPTNEAMEAAISAGLPTWESIREDYDTAVKDTICEETIDKVTGETIINKTEEWTYHNPADSMRIVAKVNYLFNFLRLHFQDESVFADTEAWTEPREYSTSCYYSLDGSANGNFLKTRVNRTGNGQMTVQAMNTEGKTVGKPINVVGRDEDEINIMARDISCVNSGGSATTPVGVSSMNRIRIGSSSAAVVHQVDGVLQLGETFPDWNNLQDVKRVLRHMRIENKE